MFFIHILSFFKAQEELSSLRQECTQSTVSHNIVNLVEKEREVAISDLRRVVAEKEALKDKLKVSNEIDLFLKSNLLRKREVFRSLSVK